VAVDEAHVGMLVVVDPAMSSRVHGEAVATRERRQDRARAEARKLARLAGVEIRQARRGSGLSQRAAGSAVGLSHATVGRIERAEVANVSLLHLCLAASAAGLRASLRLYPTGDAVRDAGQVRLLEAVRRQLPPRIPWTTEAPLPIAGDLRAFDALVSMDRRVAIEAETRLGDLQALERRLSLKKRDGGIAVLILVVGDTHHNRAVLAVHRESLRGAFPLDTRRVLACLRQGIAPPADGIVILAPESPAPGSGHVPTNGQERL
jgi:transcriptional regulator with XRE-family HTH domain